MTITSAKCAAVSPSIGPMISRAMGSTKSAAMSPCSTPATIFSSAMSRIEIGARRRSSISRVHPKSATMGSATDCTLEKARLTASTPGRSAAL